MPLVLTYERSDRANQEAAQPCESDDCKVKNDSTVTLSSCFDLSLYAIYGFL